MCSVVRGDAGETAAAGARCPEAEADVHTIAIDLSLKRRRVHLDTIKSALQLFIKLNVRLCSQKIWLYSQSVTALLICSLLRLRLDITGNSVQFGLIAAF